MDSTPRPNKKQKIHDDAASSAPELPAVPIIPIHHLQKYRFANIALPNADQNNPITKSGSFRGRFTIALQAPHNPAFPILLPFFEKIQPMEGKDDPTITADVIDIDDGVLFPLWDQMMVLVSFGDFPLVSFSLNWCLENNDVDVGESETAEYCCFRSQLNSMISRKGGFLELQTKVPYPQIVSGITFPPRIKLVVVLGNKPFPSFTSTGEYWRKPDAISFWTMMLGSHPRLGAASPAFLQVQDLTRLIFSYLRFEPDYTALKKSIEKWMKSTIVPVKNWTRSMVFKHASKHGLLVDQPDDLRESLALFMSTGNSNNNSRKRSSSNFSSSNSSSNSSSSSNNSNSTSNINSHNDNSISHWLDLTSKDILREYCRFISLKTQQRDWDSQGLAPSESADPYTGFCIMEECWRLHRELDGYTEDIDILTQGHQFEYHPRSSYSVEDYNILYAKLRDLAIDDGAGTTYLDGPKKGLSMINNEVWDRIWPICAESESEEDEDEMFDDPYYSYDY